MARSSYKINPLKPGLWLLEKWDIRDKQWYPLGKGSLEACEVMADKLYTQGVINAYACLGISI